MLDNLAWTVGVGLLLIADKSGIIRFAKLSRLIVDRPDPKTLLRVLRRLES